jgi:hypothetical protein
MITAHHPGSWVCCCGNSADCFHISLVSCPFSHQFYLKCLFSFHKNSFHKTSARAAGSRDFNTLTFFSQDLELSVYCAAWFTLCKFPFSPVISRVTTYSASLSLLDPSPRNWFCKFSLMSIVVIGLEKPSLLFIDSRILDDDGMVFLLQDQNT